MERSRRPSPTMATSSVRYQKGVDGEITIMDLMGDIS